MCIAGEMHKLWCGTQGAGSYVNLGTAYHMRAKCHAAKGRLEECVQDNTKALEELPDLLEALEDRAVAYEELGMMDKAEMDRQTHAERRYQVEENKAVQEYY